MFYMMCVLMSLAAGQKFADALENLDLDDLKGEFDLTNFVDLLDTGKKPKSNSLKVFLVDLSKPSAPDNLYNMINQYPLLDMADFYV